jgi:hypothetical protein
MDMPFIGQRPQRRAHPPTCIMAARKSCTTLSWAEAKARSGIAASGVKKNKEVLRKQNHGDVLAAKIIAKSGGGVKEAEDRKLKKAFRKQEEKAAAIAAQRAEEREQKRLAAMQEVKPTDRAIERSTEILQELREKETDDPPNVNVDSIDFNDEDTLAKIVECKQMQVDEIMALEAMVPEEDFVLCNGSRIDELREALELCDDDIAMRQQIAKHPPLSFYIRLQLDDDQDAAGDDVAAEMNLNAQIVVRGTLPPLYLNSDGSQQPMWSFEYVMVTDKNQFCSADKPLESMAWLDEIKLKQGMEQKAEDELLPYPCVYELAVTWLSENIFQSLNMQSHLLATK